MNKDLALPSEATNETFSTPLPFPDKSDRVLKVFFIPFVVAILWHFAAGQAALIQDRTPLATLIYAIFFSWIIKSASLSTYLKIKIVSRSEFSRAFQTLLISLLISSALLFVSKLSSTSNTFSAFQSTLSKLNFSTGSLLIALVCPILTLSLSEAYAPSWGYFNCTLLASLVIGFALGELSLLPIFFVGIFSTLMLSQKVSPYLSALYHSLFYTLLIFIVTVFL